MKQQTLALVMFISSACAPISTQECSGSWSCQHPHWLGMQQGLTIEVSLEGSNELWNDAIFAIEWWNVQAQRELFKLSANDANAKIKIVIGTMAEHQLGHTGTLLDVEKCELKEADIIISDKLEAGEWRSQTIAHELGHAIGMDHSTDEVNLMFCVQSCALNECSIDVSIIKTLD